MSNNRLPSLEWLATFVAVVAEGSFTAGALARSLPRASATRHVAELERALGVRLVERTTRRMRVSEAGAELFERAKRILDEVRAAEDAARERTHRVAGPIRVSAPIEYGMTFLAPVVTSFVEKHPAARVSVELSSRRVDLVEDRVDVAVRIGPLADSTYVARRLGGIEFWLCASPKLTPRPRRPEDLAGVPFLRFEASAGVRSWRLTRGARAVEITPTDGPITANNFALVRDAAIAGLGLARLPSFYAEEAIADGRLVRVLPRWSFGEMAVHALTLPGPRPSRTRAFVEHLAKAMSGRGPAR